MAFTSKLGTAASRLGNIKLGLGASQATGLIASGGTATTAGTVALRVGFSAATGAAGASSGAVVILPLFPTTRLPTLAAVGEISKTVVLLGVQTNKVVLGVHGNEAVVDPNPVGVLMPA